MIVLIFFITLRPVHVCKFLRNLYHIMSGSDDKHVRLFDLATGSTLMKLKAHKVNLVIIHYLFNKLINLLTI